MTDLQPTPEQVALARETLTPEQLALAELMTSALLDHARQQGWTAEQTAAKIVHPGNLDRLLAATLRGAEMAAAH